MILGIVAGEASGDRLGAGLMAAVRSRRSDVRFVGVGGELMLAEGLESVAGMDRLAVNGFIEPVKRVPDLVRILRELMGAYDAMKPRAFIGIDFNVFNFILERLLKRRGLATAHYVSPSVYAWRRGRIGRISRSVDLLLTLYPFEPAFYRDVPVEAIFVGHPLADEIGPEAGGEAQRRAARRALGLPETGTVVAVLPGSRRSEVRLMAGLFLEACEQIRAGRPEVRFVVPALNDDLAALLRSRVAAHPDLNVTIYPGNGRQGLTACNAALVKSGTSTLEAMLLHRPMVVSYRLGELTYQVVRRLLRTPYVALPNILAGTELVPELLQHDATPSALAENLLTQLDNGAANAEYLARFEALHGELRQGANERAADALLSWLDRLPTR